MRAALVFIGGFIIVALLAGMSIAGSYNHLVTLDQAVRSQWAQVENVYQRRADLIPNLVETVKGAADFEKSTYVAVAEARSNAGRVASGANVPDDPAAFAKFSAAQDGLSSALGRLLVDVERYPDLKASRNFEDLQAQLEGAENRIAVERMRFNVAAQTFNTARDSFPTVVVAGLFGTRFNEKPYFQARPGSQTAPPVKF